MRQQRCSISKTCFIILPCEDLPGSFLSNSLRMFPCPKDKVDEPSCRHLNFTVKQIDDREIQIILKSLSEGVVVRLDAAVATNILRHQATRLQATPRQAGAAGSGGSEMQRDLHRAQSRQDTPLRLMLNCFHNKRRLRNVDTPRVSSSMAPSLSMYSL